VTDFDTVDFYTDESVVDDPFAYFAHLRGKCPVVHLPEHDVMAVTTYDDTVRVLRDHETFSSCNAVGGPFPGFSEEPDASDDISEFLEQHRGELPMSEYAVALDGAEHHAQRGLALRLFTPKRMRENEEYTWGLADRQIDEFIGTGKVEVLRGYGYPFALLVIADLLGVPEEDHRVFRKHLGGLPQIDGDADAVSLDPLAFLQGRFAEYVEDRRREPRQDVLTQLATATYPDGSIPDVDTVCRMATFLFAAGQDTTARLITASMRIIADDPEVQAYLRSDFERIPNFVEEVLRYEGVVKQAGRTARVSTTIADVDIPAGTTIALFPQAANRDPARFESPDEFRPDRSNANDHLAFGRGVHACPGGPLSRIEARVSIERFLARTTDIRIDESVHGPAGDRHFEYEPIYILHGLKELHLELTPAEDGR
jgi:cytochrome P450